MQVKKIQNIPFTSSQMNIVSMADNHGDILGIPQVIKTIQMNSEDIFVKSKSESTQNILSISGDYFMNPSKMGVLTNPTLSIGDLQYNFLSKLMYEVKRHSNGDNFDTVYTMGNHCFGGGDEWIYKKLGKANFTTLVTNINTKQSPVLRRWMQDEDSLFTRAKIYSIPDSKNPQIESHVLFLGVTIPSTYYNSPENIKNTKFIDQTNKNDTLFKKEDLKNTIKILKKDITNFKEKYPDGVVVLQSHMGNRISMMFAEEVPDINIILNAHDHREYSCFVGNTLIFSHGQNNKFFRGINLFFDDKGKLSYIKDNKFETEPYSQMARNDKKLQKYVQMMLKKDLEPIVYYDVESGKPEEMVLDNSIRYKNSVLANYITSGIKTALNKKYPEVDCVGLPSSSLRNGLKSNHKRSTFNNIDLIDMFKGIDQNVSDIVVGKITGKELTGLITENIQNNLKSQTRNAIIQWSDLQINKKLIEEIDLGISDKKYIDAIKIRSKNNDFENIKPDKEYCIALSEKYMLKKTKNITYPSKIIDKFKKINESYDSLFKEYLDMIDRNVKITNNNREERIIF